MMQRSAGTRAKSRKAAAVIASNTVIWLLAFTASISSSAWARSSSETSAPARRIRSLKRTRCGEVKTWTRKPAASAMARRKAQVLPLPLVPATWITGGR